MAIKSITLSEFNAFEPARLTMIVPITEEVEWFVDGARNIIATLLLDKIDDDWSYVVLGRDERGSFRGVEVQCSIETRLDAKTKLLSVMGGIESSGQSVFPQGD